MTSKTSSLFPAQKCEFCNNLTMKRDSLAQTDPATKSVVVDSSRTSRILRDRQAFYENFLKMPQALKSPDRNNLNEMHTKLNDDDVETQSPIARPSQQRPAVTVDTNVYTIKKSLMTLLCLLIIIMVNSIWLKFVLKNGRTLFNTFYSLQLTLGISSVILSIIIGIVLMYSARLNYNDQYKQRKLDFINNVIMVLLFFLCIINIFLVSMN